MLNGYCDPSKCSWVLLPTGKPTVGVNPLVRHGDNLRGMVQKTGDEILSDWRHAGLISCVIEGIGVPLEEGDVGVHSRPGIISKGLRHEGGFDPFEGGDLPDDHPEGHDVVCHRQRISVAKVNFVLSGSGLVVAELYRDTHLLQDVDGVATEIGARPQGGVVEVATVVQCHRGFPWMVLIIEQIELDLWMDIEGKAHSPGTTHRPLEDVPGVGR